MKIKHIFFDLDHTLWDFERNSDLTFQKIFAKHSLEVDADNFLKVYKPLNQGFWKLYREEKITKKELRYQRLKTTFDTFGYSASDDLIHIIAKEYIEFLPHFNYLFDGTFEILDYLKDKYKLHIITNGFEEVQLKKLKSSKISHYFNAIIISESVGVKKPNPKIFNYALELANAEKENSIMIGDSIEADIEGAIDFGIQAIYCDFEDRNIKNKKFKTIISLFEIKQYL